MQNRNKYTPDILDCLANLSSDEVFTPPEVVNKMLDLLPEEVFKSKKTTFLDPFTKSGVFLREITKRLLEKQLPNYKDISSEIELTEKTAIQNAIKEGSLKLNDENYSEKAKNIGREAVNNHEKAIEFNLFEKRLQEELDRILKTQVFGIAITEITANLSRRSLYCSKNASGKYSISASFKNENGNIRFKPMKHTWDEDPVYNKETGKWEGAKCIFCKASSEMFERPNELEQHAYEFIHTKNLEEIYMGLSFDVIVGNPPYQLADGGAAASAIAIYNKFIEQAKRLNPKYLSMIIPARWMTGGKGLDDFRKMMLNDKSIKELHDFADSKMCFKGVDIKGGVCFFLRDKDYNGKCKCVRYDANGITETMRYLVEDGDDIFIRENKLINIKNKVKALNEISLSTIVSPLRPYGLRGDTMKNASKYGLPEFSKTPIENGYEILGLEKNKRTWKYIPKEYPLPRKNGIGKYKIFVPRAYGCGSLGEVPSTPVLGTPVQICTETFLEIGCFDEEKEAENLLKYLKTKFFRCLVGIKKQTQDASSKVYQFVPIQDFTKNSDIDWNKSIKEIDKQLYEKYNFTNEEIDFINSNISSMGN